MMTTDWGICCLCVAVVSIDWHSAIVIAWSKFGQVITIFCEINIALAVLCVVLYVQLWFMNVCLSLFASAVVDFLPFPESLVKLQTIRIWWLIQDKSIRALLCYSYATESFKRKALLIICIFIILYKLTKPKIKWRIFKMFRVHLLLITVLLIFPIKQFGLVINNPYHTMFTSFVNLTIRYFWGFLSYKGFRKFIYNIIVIIPITCSLRPLINDLPVCLTYTAWYEDAIAGIWLFSL